VFISRRFGTPVVSIFWVDKAPHWFHTNDVSFFFICVVPCTFIIIILYIQQMHTLFYVKHFIGLPTCFDPQESSSRHLIHRISLCCFIYYTYKVLNSMWLSYKCIVCTESVTSHDPPWTHKGHKNDTSASIKAYTQYTQYTCSIATYCTIPYMYSTYNSITMFNVWGALMMIPLDRNVLAKPMKCFFYIIKCVHLLDI
jgi:hypothetical protein